MRRVLALLALAALPACAGPEKPLELGFREVPSDVVLGDQSSPSPSPSPGATAAPPVVVLPPPPSVVTLPPPPLSTAPPVSQPRPPIGPDLPDPSQCRTADPFAAPALEAPATIEAPPRPGGYVFRNDGTFTVSGANARSGRFPALSFRVVGNVARDDSGFSWTVEDVFSGARTVTTYRVAEDETVPGVRGLYVERIASRSSDGRTSDFRPVPSLKLASLPLVRGESNDARGVDPQSRTVMQFTATVSGKDKVDACGTQLDSWTISLTNGRLVSPTADLAFSATYQVGTQYGGLVLRDTVDFQGTDGDAGVKRVNTSTISQVPKR